MLLFHFIDGQDSRKLSKLPQVTRHQFRMQTNVLWFQVHHPCQRMTQHSTHVKSRDTWPLRKPEWGRSIWGKPSESHPRGVSKAHSRGGDRPSRNSEGWVPPIVSPLPHPSSSPHLHPEPTLHCTDWAELLPQESESISFSPGAAAQRWGVPAWEAQPWPWSPREEADFRVSGFWHSCLSCRSHWGPLWKYGFVWVSLFNPKSVRPC